MVADPERILRQKGCNRRATHGKLITQQRSIAQRHVPILCLYCGCTDEEPCRVLPNRRLMRESFTGNDALWPTAKRRRRKERLAQRSAGRLALAAALIRFLASIPSQEPCFWIRKLQSVDCLGVPVNPRT